MAFVAHGGAIIGVVAKSSSSSYCRDVSLLHADLEIVAVGNEIDNGNDEDISKLL